LVLGALKIKLSLHSSPPPLILLHQPQCGYNSLFLGLSTIFRRWHVSFIALALDVVVAVDVLPNGHIRAFIVARIRLPWPMHKSVIECEPELESESDQERFQESQWKAKRERDIWLWARVLVISVLNRKYLEYLRGEFDFIEGLFNIYYS